MNNKYNLIFLDNETYKKANCCKFHICKLNSLKMNYLLNKNTIYYFNLKRINNDNCNQNDYNCSILFKQQIIKNWFINRLIEINKDLKLKLNKSNKTKPSFNNKNVHFSLSHSGNYVVFIWSNKPIGIDIQKIENISYEKILSRFQINVELTHINNYSSFTKWWTQNEAYIKFANSECFQPEKSKSINLFTMRFKLKYFISVCC